MTDTGEDRLYEEAATWHARVDVGDVDWDAFARWLDADPAHQAAYDQVAMIDDDVTNWARLRGLSADVYAAAPASSGAARHWWLAGTAAAAVLVGAISIPMLTRSPVPTTIYETSQSGQKIVSLEDGSSVRLDRGTRLAVEGGANGRIKLEKGAAYFTVRHDPSRSFAVQSGEFTIRDIGTRFAVTRGSAAMTVAVEEGAVEVVRRDGPATIVRAGHMLDASATDLDAGVRDIDASSVASWRNGRLIYDNTPLTLVAADASRYASQPISVDPAIADLKLSGVLLIGDGSHLVDQIQAFLPVNARREGDHIRLVGRTARH